MESKGATLKDLFLSLKDYLINLWKKKFIILISGALVAALFVVNAIRSTPTYEAEYRFFVETSKTSGGLNGILGQFGFGGGIDNLSAQILEVAKSSSLMSDLLLDSIADQTLGDFILEKYQLHDHWALDPSFKFNHDKMSELDLEEKRVLKRLIKFISVEESEMKRIFINDLSGIYTLQSKTIDEELSLKVSRMTYEWLRDFFQNKIMKSQIETKEILSQKVDSLNNEIAKISFAIGKFEDRNTSLFNKSTQSRRELLKAELSGLFLAKGEVLKSYEIADYSYRNQKKLFMLIEEPFGPLSMKKKNSISEGVKGFILGAFLFALVFSLIKFIRDILNEDLNEE